MQKELKQIETYLDRFIEKRDWDRFRSPKNLCMALSVEVAELTEIFQWMTEEQSRKIVDNEQVMQDIDEDALDTLLSQGYTKDEIREMIENTIRRQKCKEQNALMKKN